jgi:hypothetical protein
MHFFGTPRIILFSTRKMGLFQDATIFRLPTIVLLLYFIIFIIILFSTVEKWVFGIGMGLELIKLYIDEIIIINIIIIIILVDHSPSLTFPLSVGFHRGGGSLSTEKWHPRWKPTRQPSVPLRLRKPDSNPSGEH